MKGHVVWYRDWLPNGLGIAVVISFFGNSPSNSMMFFLPALEWEV